MRPIHQNLDTSFVNLSALVKYLQKRQFKGTVEVSLSGYEAEIVLKENNKLAVKENDLISGRIAEGEEAFRRILIRSRESGGSINVYQNPQSGVKPEQKEQILPPVKSEPVVVLPKPIKTHYEIILPNETKNGNGNGKSNGTGHTVKNETVDTLVEPPVQQPKLPDFPFELTNNFETKAKIPALTPDDWQILLKLTVELLGNVDRSLAGYNLSFSAAFKKVRAEIADDYPFLNPSAGVFEYEDGRVSMTGKVNETVYVNSICASLERIVERLGQNEKFAELHRDTVQLIIALINKRREHYDKFGFTVPLKRMLGI